MRAVPHHKVTDLEMGQNIFERMLNISTLSIFTPGTASMQQGGLQRAEIRFIGLKDSASPFSAISEILKGLSCYGRVSRCFRHQVLPTCVWPG